MKASDKTVRTTHPIVEIVREEIPILEFRVKLVVDCCGVLVEVLGKTCSNKGQAPRFKHRFCGE